MTDRKPFNPAADEVAALVPLLAKNLSVSDNVSNTETDWEKVCKDMDKMFEEQAALQLEGKFCVKE